MGVRQSRRFHDTDRLVPAAIDIMYELLTEGGPDWTKRVPLTDLDLYLTAPAQTAALATITRGGMLLTTSALLSGLDESADHDVVQHLQSLLHEVTASWGFTPKDDMLLIAERPVILSVPWPFAAMSLRSLAHDGQDPLAEIASVQDAMAFAADIETCLAAAFFLRAHDQPLNRT